MMRSKQHREPTVKEVVIEELQTSRDEWWAPAKAGLCEARRLYAIAIAAVLAAKKKSK